MNTLYHHTTKLCALRVETYKIARRARAKTSVCCGTATKRA